MTKKRGGNEGFFAELWIKKDEYKGAFTKKELWKCAIVSLRKNDSAKNGLILRRNAVFYSMYILLSVFLCNIYKL